MDRRPVPEKRSHEDMHADVVQGKNIETTAPKNATKVALDFQAVYVSNLPPKYSHKDLLTFASEFGEVKSKTFSTDNASIVFVNKNAAFRMKKTNKHFGGYKLNIDFLRTRCNTQDQQQNKKKKKKNAGKYPQGHLVAPIDHGSVTARLDSKMNFNQELDTLCCQLLPTDPTLSYTQVIQDLHFVVSPMLCGYYQIIPFGSTVSGLAFKGSDIDLLVDWKATMHRYHSSIWSDQPVYETSIDDMWLMEGVHSCMMRRPQCFQNINFVKFAKVPILKFKHVSTQVNCDLSFKNVSAVQNSNLIKFYTTVDKRVKPLLFVIKYWAKYFRVVRLGWFNNYALALLVLFYLQQLDEPIIPPVHALQTICGKKLYVDGWECSFSTLWGFLERPLNNLPLPLLLQGFFEFYATFDFQTTMVCPLLGRSMPKSVLQNLTQLPPEMDQFRKHPSNKDFRLDCAMFVQDPFIQNYNVTRAIQKSTLLAFQNVCLTSLYVLSEFTVSAASTGVLKHLLHRRTVDLMKVPSLWQKPPDGKTGFDSPFIKVLQKIAARSQPITETTTIDTRGAANIVSTASAHKTTTTSTVNTATVVTPSTSTVNTATVVTPSTSTVNTATGVTPSTSTVNTATCVTPSTSTVNTATVVTPSTSTVNTATMVASTSSALGKPYTNIARASEHKM